MASRHFSTPPPHLDAPFRLYPISILKPLKGADSGLKENLLGFFYLDHPSYELIFSVADPSDPAIPIVEALISAHPGFPARIIIGTTENAGPNPKVNNLLRSYELARFDWVLVSDSNVRVPRDYLRRMAAHIDSGVGIVTSAVLGTGARGIGGEIEAVFLNSFYSRGMILASWLGHPCVVGKSMLFQKSEANRFGGIRALARYLAEDYMAGEAFRKLGLRVLTASDPVHQHIGEHSFSAFWSRHLRWGRIRKSQAPLAFAIEPFLTSILSGILGAWGASRALGIPFATFLFLHLLAWSACDWAVMTKMKAKIDLRTPPAWLIRELLALPLWLHIASGRGVRWRGRKLTLGQGGILLEENARARC